MRGGASAPPLSSKVKRMSESSLGGWRDRVVLEAVGWLGFVCVAFWLARDFDAPIPHFPPGAAMWPHIVLFVMAVAAVVLLVSRFLPQTERLRNDEAPEYLDEVPDDLANVTWRTVGVFVIPLAWAYAMHQFGFLLVTPIFLILFTWLMGVKSWRTLLVFGFGFHAFLVLVFYKLIYTPLPMGAGIFHTLNGEIFALIQ